MSILDIEKQPDRIAEIFRGRAIFVSGGTGFLGKTLIEKLLRCCTGLETIYILVRKKKGRTPDERLSDITNNALFTTLREQKPHAFGKLKVIHGDVTEVDLGISDQDRSMLEEEVEFIFHLAATTRFDDTMKYAVTMNTRGTKYMLDLAHKCKRLQCFIHVSTAYVYPNEKILYEKSYPPPANPQEVLNSINWIKEDAEGKFKRALLGDCPNTYTFTKALAESLVEAEMETLPAIIVRPSLVVPIWKEPLPGWCNNLQGPMGLFVGAGKGVIRSMYMDSQTHADMIPADICINAMLCSTLFFVFTRQRRYFNLTSTAEYKYSWEHLIELGREVVNKRMPFNQILWYPGGSMTKSRLQHRICFYLFQLIPAIFVDLLLKILGYPPVLYNIQMRIDKSDEMFEYYTSRAWDFSNEKSYECVTLMNEKERKIYKMDGDGLDLKDYLTNCIHSIRIHILKETDDMLPAARRNMKIMWVIDWLVKIGFLVMMVSFIYRIIFSRL